VVVKFSVTILHAATGKRIEGGGTLEKETRRGTKRTNHRLGMHVFNGRRLDVGRNIGNTCHAFGNARDLCLKIRIGKNA